tara:strand:+ start:5119 stop:5319 length:201 start_codon:yes stop_codon:yes gene_type:complete
MIVTFIMSVAFMVPFGFRLVAWNFDEVFWLCGSAGILCAYTCWMNYSSLNEIEQKKPEKLISSQYD